MKAAENIRTVISVLEARSKYSGAPADAKASWKTDEDYGLWALLSEALQEIDEPRSIGDLARQLMNDISMRHVARLRNSSQTAGHAPVPVPGNLGGGAETVSHRPLLSRAGE